MVQPLVQALGAVLRDDDILFESDGEGDAFVVGVADGFDGEGLAGFEFEEDGGAPVGLL